LTIDASRLDDLRDFMNERAKTFSHPPVTYDLKLAPGELKAAFIDKLEPLRPYGMGNKKPRIAVVGGWVKRVIVRKEKHINIVVNGPIGDTEAMIWNAIGTPLGDALVGSEDFYVDLAGDAKIDTYGYRRAVLIVDDAVVHGAVESEAA
jgi:single-stranded-DNA-specific exonuclease